LASSQSQGKGKGNLTDLGTEPCGEKLVDIMPLVKTVSVCLKRAQPNLGP
jgi:hypothetical protein